MRAARKFAAALYPEAAQASATIYMTPAVFADRTRGTGAGAHRTRRQRRVPRGAWTPTRWWRHSPARQARTWADGPPRRSSAAETPLGLRADHAATVTPGRLSRVLTQPGEREALSNALRRAHMMATNRTVRSTLNPVPHGLTCSQRCRRRRRRRCRATDGIVPGTSSSRRPCRAAGDRISKSPTSAAAPAWRLLLPTGRSRHRAALSPGRPGAVRQRLPSLGLDGGRSRRWASCTTSSSRPPASLA